MKKSKKDATVTVKFLDYEGEDYKTIEKLDFKSTSLVTLCFKQSWIYIQCEYPANRGTPFILTMNDEQFCTSWNMSNSNTYVAGPTWVELESNTI